MAVTPYTRSQIDALGQRLRDGTIHIITREQGCLVETQVRTLFQHRWAEYSEKLADRYGADLKYDGGPAEIRALLRRLSTAIAKFEISEGEAEQVRRRLSELESAARERSLSAGEQSEESSLVRYADVHRELLSKVRDLIRDAEKELRERL